MRRVSEKHLRKRRSRFCDGQTDAQGGRLALSLVHLLGTYYLRARYYAPTIGRFTQQDTHWTNANRIYGDNPQKTNEHEDRLGIQTYAYVPQISAVMQSGNLYVYCMNDPVMYVDVSGELAWPGEVHQSVVYHIKNNSNGYIEAEKRIDYENGLFGRADLVGKEGEIWEVKPTTNKGKHIQIGKKQVEKYCRGKLHDGSILNNGASLKPGGNIFPEKVTYEQWLSDGLYKITYQYKEGGVIGYTYELLQSKIRVSQISINEEKIQIAMTIAIVGVGAILILDFTSSAVGALLLL